MNKVKRRNNLTQKNVTINMPNYIYSVYAGGCGQWPKRIKVYSYTVVYTTQ